MLPYQAFRPERAQTRNGPHRVYGVCGDGFLQRIVIASLLEWSVEESARDFNTDELDGEICTIADVAGACGNLPFLSERRAVLVRRAERLEGLGKSDAAAGGEDKKAKKGGLSPAKKLTDTLENLPPTTVLILAHTPETPEPGSRAGVTRCINAAVDKEIERLGIIVDCTVDPKNANMVAAVLQSEAARRGYAVVQGAVQHLVARCGHDIESLLGELDKCALRAGDGAPITPTIIDEMTRRQPSDSVFDLTDAIGERKGARALTLLKELVDGGDAPEQLLSLLVRHLRHLLQARAFMDANLPLDATLLNRLPPGLATQLPKDGRENLANILQAQGWMGRRLGSQARNFTSQQIQAALEAAYEADLSNKGIEGDGGFESNKSSAATLEILVAKLCA